MKERMKALRVALNLTQKQFADRIGAKHNTISTYEAGATGPSGPVITAICKEFGVNREWLETGNGPMFNPAPGDDLIAQVAQQYHLSPEWAEIIRVLVSLDPDEQAAGVKLLRGIVQQYQQEPEPDPLPTKEAVMEEAARIAGEHWELEKSGRGKNRQPDTVQAKTG